MPTLKQKIAYKEVVKGSSITKAMQRAHYAVSTSKRTNKLTRTKGWQELMEKYLPDKDLARVHKEGLSANKLMTSLTEPDREYPDYSTRHKYLETAYKIKGRLKEWEGDEGRPLNQNILILIKKVYGEGNRTGNTPDALLGEESGMFGRSG